MSELELSETAYEEAETAYLTALRADANRDELMTLSEVLATTAARWNAAAYAAFHASEGADRAELDLLTERTEVLEELWAAVQAAYRS